MDTSSTTRTRSAATVTETEVAGFPALHGKPEGVGRATVVLLHGAFADHLSFAPWVAYLAGAGFDVWAPARRGRVGIGPRHAAGLVFEDYVDDTLTVLDALTARGSGGRPVLVGHSLGGLIAQRVAEGGHAAAIALLASAPPEPLTAQDVALPYFGPLMPTIMDGQPFVVSDEACSALALNHVPEVERPAIHARLTPESGLVYRALLSGSVEIDARRVRVPVFVAGAEDDRIIAVEHVRHTAQHFGVEPHLYPGHGHWIIDEPGSEVVMDDVVSWLVAEVV